jgi:hypothetical protein
VTFTTTAVATQETCCCGARIVLRSSDPYRLLDEFREAHEPCRVRGVQACPVCGGCGSVPADFYTRLGVATSASRERCRTCEGRGVVTALNQKQ